MQVSKVTEFFKLLWLNLLVTIEQFYEYCRVVVNYYRNTIFRHCDLYLLRQYLFKNPFKICRDFLFQRGESEIYAYGETPLTTFEQIVKKCNILPHDTVYELGCGRGRTCFWLSAFVRCKVIGIEFVPEFVEIAKKTQKKYNLSNIDFRLEDFTICDFSDASVIYLYGTCLPAETIQKLVKQFQQLAVGTKIITVSYALKEFVNKTSLKVVNSFPAKFTWGTGTVYLHEVSKKY